MRYPGSFSLWREFLASLSPSTGKVEAEPGDLVERIFKRLNPRIEVEVVKAHTTPRGVYSMISISLCLGDERVHLISVFGDLVEESIGYYLVRGADVVFEPYNREVPFTIMQRNLSKRILDYEEEQNEDQSSAAV